MKWKNSDRCSVQACVKLKIDGVCHKHIASELDFQEYIRALPSDASGDATALKMSIDGIQMISLWIFSVNAVALDSLEFSS